MLQRQAGRMFHMWGEVSDLPTGGCLVIETDWPDAPASAAEVTVEFCWKLFGDGPISWVGNRRCKFAN